VFVGEVAGQNRAGKTGVYFLKSYAGFAEFAGAKILYAVALAGHKMSREQSNPLFALFSLFTVP
jgi:hypothetical protein